jgi:class 3 adenylate cyclase/tetratricopeptide (TPR) repeat protein
MDPLRSFVPIDRLHALAHGAPLPDRTTGAALLADISGFTALTEAFAAALGPQHGSEELVQILIPVFDALIAEVHQYGGSVLAFSGDAMTCWFDGDDGSRAATCALAQQRAMAPFATLPLPGGEQAALALKVAVAAGPARRFLIGDPARGVLDAPAGPTLERLGVAEELAARGEVLVDAATWAALAGAGPAGDPCTDLESGAEFHVLAGLARPAAPAPWPPLGPEAVPDEQVRPWVQPAVWDRLQHGRGAFLAELRPVVALFLRFTGIDYARPTAGARLDTFIHWVQEVLARYEATLLQLTIGEKGSYLYAAFGAPLAHPDEAARAAAAALELRTPPASCSFIRGVQIGISQGQVWTGAYGGQARRTYGVLGDAVNLAARLMQSAAPGGILVTQAVRQAAGPRFGWAALPALRVKGKAAAVPVYGLVAERTEAEQALREPGAGAPLVGRAAELAQLDAALAQARAGHGQIVGITGEAGLGKSRLVQEAARRARAAGLPVYAGAAQSYGTNTPYLAWHTVWHAFFDLDPDGTPDEIALELEDKLAEIDPALLERLPLLGPALGLPLPDNALTAALDPALRKASLEALLVACLRARAAATPLALVLEDCQWLDPLSHDLLEAVGRAIPALPVLVLLAYRPPELERLRAPQVETLPHFTAIRLAPFAPDEARRLVAARLGDDHAVAWPPDLIAQIAARGDGNPFYLEELINYLAESGVDPRDGAALAAVAWPASLQSLLLARIDQLTEQQRTVLKVASIVGRRFVRPELWGVHPDLGPPEPVSADLAELDRLDLTPLDTPEPEPAYLFKHQMTREVTYSSLPRALRARLHEQFAAWLEAGSAVAGGPPPLDLLAYHYGQSGNTAKQREYYRKAGDAAAAAYAGPSAMDYYERLLTVCPPGEERAARLALGQVLTEWGGWEAAAAHYHAALAEAETAGDTAAVGQAAHGLSRVRRYQAAWAEAETWLERARAAYDAASDAGAVSRVLSDLGDVYRALGDYERAGSLQAESIARARAAGDLHGQADALHRLGVLREKQGEYAEATALFEESMVHRRALGDRPGIALCLSELATVALDQGDYARSRALRAESLALQREVGARPGIAQMLNNLGNVLDIQGDHAGARALYDEALTVARELGEPNLIALTLGNLGLVAQAQKDYATARARLEEAQALLRDLGDISNIAVGLVNLGLLALDQADYPAAHTFFAESLAGTRALGEKFLIAYGLLGVAAATIGQATDLVSGQRAARLAGAAAGLLARIGAQLEQQDQGRLDAVRAQAAAALGADAATAAWDAGAALSWEAAVAEALANAPVA